MLAPILAVLSIVVGPAPEPTPEPVTCDGHAHAHSNPEHRRWVKRLYRNPWLPKKATVRHRHMLRCAEPADRRSMVKRWRVAKSPYRGVPIHDYRRWIAVGTCEQPGPGRWGIWWSAHPYGEYQGGLGFWRGTWLYYRRYAPGGHKYPATAAHASWRQQMRVAQALLREVGWAWSCRA